MRWIYSLCIFFIFPSVGLFVMGFFDSLFSFSGERCNKDWVIEDINGLEDDLDRHVYGQYLAVDIILGALNSHKKKMNRKKPLVFNFHGWPGGGKGYIADFIIKNWFKNGEKSKFVKKYLAKINFPLQSEVNQYQKRLQSELEETISACSKAVFIFDEVDKYPAHVLDGIKAYLDYNTNIQGYDYREAIFIFITNTGDQLITNITLDKHLKGTKREDLRLRDYEEALMKLSYNTEGGHFQSDLIRHHLIDYVVPFLPLERKHVKSCIEFEFINQGGSPSYVDEIISEVINELSFGPAEHDLYSISGCKKVSELVSQIIEREVRRQRRRNHQEF